MKKDKSPQKSLPGPIHKEKEQKQLDKTEKKQLNKTQNDHHKPKRIPGCKLHISNGHYLVAGHKVVQGAKPS